jgi:hypothetical protein
MPHVHQGLDIFAAGGTPVVAVAPAVVTSTKSGAVSGLAVKITDRDGVQYFYGHLDSFARGLRPGQRVQAGRILGYIGNTGNAAGGPTHVHFEILLRGLPTPPKPYVDRWLLAAEAKARALRHELERSQHEAPLAHRDLIEAPFGGGLISLEARPAGLSRDPADSSMWGLTAMGGGLLLALLLLGALRRAPRRRPRPVSAEDVARTAELLERLCARAERVAAEIERERTTREIVRQRPSIVVSAGRRGRHRAPSPLRVQAQAGLAVVRSAVALPWSLGH